MGSMRPRRGQGLQAAAYLTPLLVGTVIFVVLPAAYNIYISFTNFGLFHFQKFEWVGLRNYLEIFAESPAFVPVLGWTVTWTVLTSFLNIAGGLLLALLLNHPGLRERNLYRTLLIVPWALPGIISIQMWAALLGGNGPVNLALGALGMTPVRWLGDPFWAKVSLLAVNLWLSYPFFMVVFLAALQSIPRELYEAATMDGATGWASFRYITLPLLGIATVPLVVTQIAFQFNNFNVIYLLTGGNPLAFPGADYGATDTLVTYGYKLITSVQRYGLAAAYGVVIFLIIGPITYINSRLTRAFEEVR
ncbi:MAG: sugar ABC transporter permease [Bacillota bacterium]